MLVMGVFGPIAGGHRHDRRGHRARDRGVELQRPAVPVDRRRRRRLPDRAADRPPVVLGLARARVLVRQGVSRCDADRPAEPRHGDGRDRDRARAGGLLGRSSSSSCRSGCVAIAALFAGIGRRALPPAWEAGEAVEPPSARERLGDALDDGLRDRAQRRGRGGRPGRARRAEPVDPRRPEAQAQAPALTCGAALAALLVACASLALLAAACGEVEARHLAARVADREDALGPDRVRDQVGAAVPATSRPRRAGLPLHRDDERGQVRS